MARNFAFKMITTTDKYTEVYDALLVLDDNDADLSNGTPNKCLISEIFAAHKLIELDSSCLLGDLAPGSVLEIEGNNNGSIDQGEVIEVKLSLTNTTGLELRELSGTANIMSGDLQAEVASSDLSWDLVPAGATVEAKGSVRILVKSDADCGGEFTLKFVVTGMGKKTEVQKTFVVGKFLGVTEKKRLKTFLLISLMKNHHI